MGKIRWAPGVGSEIRVKIISNDENFFEPKEMIFANVYGLL